MAAGARAGGAHRLVGAGGASAAPTRTTPHSLQAWEQGRFIRFHGLAQWVGWLWPYRGDAGCCCVGGRAMTAPARRGARTGSARRRTGARAAARCLQSPHELLQAPHLLLPERARQRRSLLCRSTTPQAGASTTASRASRRAGLAGPGGVRVNKAGCLDRCAGGPVAVVYPEAVWYTYVDQQRHRRDRRVAPEATAGSSSACCCRPTSAADVGRESTHARGASPARPAPSSARSTRPMAAAARRRRGLPSAPAARRHDGQQGRADAGARLRAAGLARGALQLPRHRRFGRASGTRAAARSTTRWPWSTACRADGAAAGARRLLVRRLCRLARRARRRRGGSPSAWCWSARRRPTSTSPPVPADTLVIHGEADDVVPLQATLDWARPQHLPVVVVPGVGHFFHGQLPLAQVSWCSALAR